MIDEECCDFLPWDEILAATVIEVAVNSTGDNEQLFVLTSEFFVSVFAEIA